MERGIQFACRTCLAIIWRNTPIEITKWLAMWNPGGAKAASLHANQWSRDGGSGWNDHNGASTITAAGAGANQNRWT